MFYEDNDYDYSSDSIDDLFHDDYYDNDYEYDKGTVEYENYYHNIADELIDE